MRKKIAILGSTGSIGRTTLEVIKSDKKNFEIVLLTANNNYKKLIQQAKEFKVRNVLIKNEIFFNKVKNALKNHKTKVYCGNKSLCSIVKKKLDYTMAAIVGIAGLKPTIECIKISNNVAIANKESIICGWDLISKSIKKYKTNIIPVDSEHFSIMELSKNSQDNEISEIIITASGGPFLKTPIRKLKYVKPHEAIRHPNWKMGKKISIDSASLMNKVFELIEATKLFKFNHKKYKILIHPQSYVHSIICFKNGLTKMILHNPDMKIPISNIINGCDNKYFNVKKINSKTLNKLNFYEVDKKRFPSVNLISKCLNTGSLAATILNASNEELVSMYLKKKLKFTDIVRNLHKILKHKNFVKYAKKRAKNIKDIYMIDKWARLKIRSMSVR